MAVSTRVVDWLANLNELIVTEVHRGCDARGPPAIS